MPRVKTQLRFPKFAPNKALIQVRKATSSKTQTQKGFAKAVGINSSTLQKTEEGHRLLQFEEAIRIMAYTGADAESLIVGKRAKAANKRAYSREVFKRWRERPVNERAVEMSADRAGLFAAALVRASSRRSAVLYRVVVAKMFDALKEVEREFNLTEVLDCELRERCGKPEVHEVGFGKLKKMLHVGHGKRDVRGWDYEKAAKVPDLRLFRVERIQYPVFELAAGGSDPSGNPIVYDSAAVDRVLIRFKVPWAASKNTEFELCSMRGYLDQFGRSVPFELEVPLRSRDQK
jgi:hypothetical protein